MKYAESKIYCKIETAIELYIIKSEPKLHATAQSLELNIVVRISLYYRKRIMAIIPVLG